MWNISNVCSNDKCVMIMMKAINSNNVKCNNV